MLERIEFLTLDPIKKPGSPQASVVRSRHPSNCIRSLSLKPLIWGLWKYDTSCSLLSMGGNKAEDGAISLETHWFITGKDEGGFSAPVLPSVPLSSQATPHSSLGKGVCEAVQFCKKRITVQKHSHPQPAQLRPPLLSLASTGCLRLWKH